MKNLRVSSWTCPDCGAVIEDDREQDYFVNAIDIVICSEDAYIQTVHCGNCATSCQFFFADGAIISYHTLSSDNELSWGSVRSNWNSAGQTDNWTRPVGSNWDAEKLETIKRDMRDDNEIPF